MSSQVNIASQTSLPAAPVAVVADYLNMTDAEIEEHAITRGHEMDATGIKWGEIASAENVRIERRYYGYAVIQNPLGAPHIWLLYIDPAMRGRKLGRRFVRELIKIYGKEFHMTVACVGSDRRRFFGNCGFVVEERDGDMRRMTTDRDHHCWR